MRCFSHICFFFTPSPAASLKHITDFTFLNPEWSSKLCQNLQSPPRPPPPNPSAPWLCYSFVFQDKSPLLFWAAVTVKRFIVIVGYRLCFFLKKVVMCLFVFFSPCPLRIQSSYAALQRINQDLEDKMHRTVRDFEPRFNFILLWYILCSFTTVSPRCWVHCKQVLWRLFEWYEDFPSNQRASQIQTGSFCSAWELYYSEKDF